ncbi:MAG: leucine-rich repeat domain-containing protein [Clostridia bacterium]|nr:leucine-rich repeat domain-containing protein [Clostridia bacterium]
MNWSYVKERMTGYLDTVGSLLLGWLGENLPRISDDWWEECVAGHLDVMHREAASLGELDLLTLLYITKMNAAALSEHAGARRTLILSVAASMRKVRNGWHHLSAAGTRDKSLVLSDLQALRDFFVMVGANAELNGAEAFLLELEKSEIEEDAPGTDLRATYLSEVREARAMILSDIAAEKNEPEPEAENEPEALPEETKTPEDPYSRGLDFHQTAKGCTVRGKGSCRDAVLSIPPVYKGKPVTRIGDGAFANAVWIKKVIIPDSVHHIGEGAFKGCTGLESVEIPFGVTGIAKDAFYRCSRLTSVSIPSTVSSLGGGAFLACSALSEVYYDAEKLKGESRSTTFALAGMETEGLTLTMGKHAREVPAGLFFSLEPEPGEEGDADTGTEEFGAKLKKVVFEDGSKCTAIGEGAFFGCKGLVEMMLPDTVMYVGALAFYDCTTLKKISLPQEVTYIGEWAFRNTGLESVDLPGSISCIPEGVFSSCACLKSVKLPKGLSEIGRRAFMDCACLETCDIPDGVAGIGALAFHGCSSLKKVDFPESLFEIGFEAFRGCSGIEEVYIPEDVVSVGYGAFRECENLSEVTVDAANVDIGRDAFSRNPSLESVEIYAENMTIGSYAFGGCPKLDFVDMMGDMQDVEPLLFSECTSLEDIRIPRNVEYIDHHAFQGCSSLKSVMLPKELVDVGICAFMECSSLEQVLFRGTPEEWDDVVFDAGNGYLINAKIYFYGKKNLSDGFGHWYYDDWADIVISEPKKPRGKGSVKRKP